MNLSSTAQATLLMTSYFSKANSEVAKPLSNSEWGRFALWLKEQKMTPADLLAPNPEELLQKWRDTKINLERILQLLNRGSSLALAVEKWQRAGLWIVTRADLEYPKRLKSRLKSGSPPVLFGCGNKSLLESGGLAVIGSRNADDDDLYYTQQVGSKAAKKNITIVSGGARGVDEAAMLGAADKNGNVIGIVADSLLKAATSKKWRKGLMDGHMVLISPFYPEAGFSTGNAMARNKYIYCLADSSLVIHSGQRGGTFSGAKENLAKHWVPLWVKPTHDKAAANNILVQSGGQWCAENVQELDLQALIAPQILNEKDEQKQQQDMFLLPNIPSGKQPTMNLPFLKESQIPSQDSTYGSFDADKEKFTNFYNIFLDELTKLAVSPLTVDKLVEFMDLQKSQIKIWLKRAVDDGFVKKLNRPVRYQCSRTTLSAQTKPEGGSVDFCK